MYLYKYRSFTLDNLVSLKENKIWFSRGVNFNDPFDCTMNVPITLMSLDTVRDFIINKTSARNLLNTGLVDMSFIDSVTEQELMKARNLINENKFSEHPLEPILSLVSQVLIKSFVCCFSKVSTNHLLWSHYADSHSGFCIRFRKDVLLKNLNIINHGDVIYNDVPINIMHGFNEKENIAKDIIFKKSSSWGYEKEFRMIHSEFAESDNDRFRVECYPDDAIDCIIFGFNSSDSNVSLVKSIMQGNNLIYKKITRDANSFELYVDTEKY
ncbi:Protein of uncharacterised function (DUF2971) [Yersinia enterocolitica]|uniref:DUF2971 domain-containing protein n=1 Tax=Yersinia enterocolitica TaxID=630 RepID=UPI0005E2ED40|nr:DUF2971 domain-containing protein [Yersinia enterocolitica]CNH38799.1 Protein of uncharacterised function (DUF2971) [Yersinia enterocolitica]CRX98799.1 Protein of uncharacterised function (DUF2971) [Yersinia enterocolitica]